MTWCHNSIDARGRGGGGGPPPPRDSMATRTHRANDPQPYANANPTGKRRGGVPCFGLPQLKEDAKIKRAEK